jgi:hypothetical protein
MPCPFPCVVMDMFGYRVPGVFAVRILGDICTFGWLVVSQ